MYPPIPNRFHELAKQIAEDFGEPEEIILFTTLFRRYPESLIRQAYEEVKKIPPEEIRKSRVALFLYLLKKYARREQQPQHSQAAEVAEDHA